MFQTFTDRSDPSKVRSRVKALRAQMKINDVAAYLVPRADQYQNEYVPAGAERLKWLTSFSGSAGTAVVLRSKAALFVDGRYTLQAPEQTDTKLFSVLQVPQESPADWIASHLKKGMSVGFDPRIHTMAYIDALEKKLTEQGIKLKPLGENLIDRIWKNRPAEPMEPVSLHPLKLAGVAAKTKLASTRKTLRRSGATAAVLTMPESIAWLLNIRGQDVPHTPLPLSMIILPLKGKPELFIARKKLSTSVRKALQKDVVIRDPDVFAERLSALEGQSVLVDPNGTSRWVADQLEAASAKIIRATDPCLLPKAKKNRAEISGARAAHARDGVAMCRFLAWLDKNAGTGQLDEIKAAKKLEKLRADTGELRDISFDTISGAGPNGAIVHYRVTTATNEKLTLDNLYLVDSGAQYDDGTTDVTRTIAVGSPTEDMRRHYTLVLKGHLAISMARFPVGTRGVDLDPFAREPLWSAGLDYDHGTGHGIGSYLSVHEGPQSISKRGMVALEPGMILSNEPGYYRTGEYGIRIENLVLVTRAKKVKGGERPMMAMQTLTLVPYDQRLIIPELLSPEEQKWVNAYHRRVRREIGPNLKGTEKSWLDTATEPLGKP